ncbi:MAG TPA: hypothetical protein VF841_06400 [Anaeromyxobacter sp.]
MKPLGTSALLPLLALALAAPAAPRAAAEEPAAGAAQGRDATSSEASGPPSSDAPATSEPKPSEPKPSEPNESGPPATGDTWLDAGHAFIEQRIFAPILRLDRFFSDERDIEPEREQSFLRWRNEVRFTEDSKRPSFATGLRATLRLPGLDRRLKRLRLVIAGDTRDAIDKLFPRQPSPGTPVDQTQADQDTVGAGDAGLRYFLLDTLAYHADLGAGALVQLPPGVYGRLRFRWAFPVGKLFLSRLALIGFWRSDVKFGTTASAELDRPVSSSLLFRLSGGGTRSERSKGIEWGSELAAIVPLPPSSAAQLAVATGGATEAWVVAPDPATGVARAFRTPQPDRTRVYARLRTDVYRRWIFVELEPEIAWPWTPERGRYSAWGLALRLEVQFQGKEAPPAPAPAPPPEPKDPEPAS